MAEQQRPLLGQDVKVTAEVDPELRGETCLAVGRCRDSADGKHHPESTED